MITKNEESKLERCLSSVKDLVDEIIIVDTGSTDNTKNIASRFNASIYDYQWDDNFSNARNFALKKSNADWNLTLDADEYIVDTDYNTFENFLKSKNNHIGKIKVLSFFEENNNTMTSQSFISRLSPKGVYFKGSVHEQLNSSYSRTFCGITVEHDGYLNTNKFDRNINLLLKELAIYPNDSYILYQVAKTYYVNKDYKNAYAYFDKFYNRFDYNKYEFAKDAIITYLYTLINTKNFEKGLQIIDDNFDKLCSYSDFYFVCGVFFTEIVAYNPQKYMCYFENIELCYLNALQLGESSDSDSVKGTGSYLAAFNLGVYYELLGNTDKYLHYYSLSSIYNYPLALSKLKSMNIQTKFT